MKPTLCLAVFLCTLLFSCKKDQLSQSLPQNSAEDNSTTNSGIVYIMKDNVGVSNATIYALNATTGALKWSNADSAYTYSPVPCVANSKLFTMVYYEPTSDLYEMSLVGYNARTGSRLWKTVLHRDDLALTNPTAANNAVYATAANKLYAINATNGKIIWRQVLDDHLSNLTSPTVANGKVYVGNKQHLFSLDAATGSINWTVSGHAQYSSLTVADGLISYNDNGTYATTVLDTNGNFKWSYHGGINGSTTVHNNLIYQFDDFYNTDNLRAFGLTEANGSIGWSSSEFNKVTVSNQKCGDPFYSNNTLYVGLADSLIAMNTLADNQKKWSFFTGVPKNYIGSQASPIESGGIVYTMSAKQVLYALNANDGTLIWNKNIGGSNVNYSPVLLNIDGTAIHPTDSGMTQ